jgi:hypothetical protein
MEAEATSGVGLAPALEQTPPITAQDVMPQQPQAAAPAPMGGPGGPGPEGMAPNVSASDMTAGPAASPGGAPAGPPGV